METTTVVCSKCGKQLVRPAKEIRRRHKAGKYHFFCDFRCAVYYYGTNQNLQHPPAQHSGGKPKDAFSPFREHLRRARNRKDKECNLTLQHLKDVWEQQNGRCPFTNVQLQFSNENPNYAASLDRIDSTKGYIIGNVQFVSETVNYAKSDQAAGVLLEFLDIVRAVVV